MPGETTNYKAKYALSTDEVRLFPGQVSQPGAETLDAALKASVLTVTSHATSFTAKSGELAEATATLTASLPPVAAANQTIGVWCQAGVTTVKTTGGEKIYGDFLNGVTSFTLALNQHIVLQSDGTRWFIVSGTPAPVVVGTPGTTGPNIISWGEITANAEILASSGDFTVTKTGTGKYKIVWKTAKSAANYAVVVTPVTLSPTYSFVTLITTSEWTVEFATSTPAAVSVEFGFMVMAAS